MKKTYFLLFGIIVYCAFQSVNAQQIDRIQRGQRGYTPPPKISNKTYIELKDPYKETLHNLSCLRFFAKHPIKLCFGRESIFYTNGK